jgi:hypothetical protein
MIFNILLVYFAHEVRPTNICLTGEAELAQFVLNERSELHKL